MTPVTPSPDALACLRAALDAAPAGLITDYDGTLAPIVRDPAQARPAAGVPALLRRLAARLALVAIVTGRAALDARRLAGADELLVVGNHGLEWLAPSAVASAPAPELDVVRAAMAAALRRLGALAIPGVTLEAKGISATAHYRAAADPAAARTRVLAALAEHPDASIDVREGRMSVELRPIAAGDKGTALLRIVKRHALRGLVVLGDDVTDLDMFRAADVLRERGGIRACIVAVGALGGAPGEAPPEVAAAADIVVADPDALVALLELAIAESR